MMLSVATHPKVNLAHCAFSSHNLFPSKNIIFPKPRSYSPSFHISALNPKRNLGVFASKAAGAVAFAEETSADGSAPSALLQKEDVHKLGVMVKPMEKPRIVLKFIWMDKNIGIALDQVIPGHGTVPVSPYYFWPRKDAWEELKVLLDSKPWISQKQMIILLNQATDIINLWQQSGGDLA
ncbi:small ribosomal subunit protein cS23-like [Nicotiana tomentosiformis]|uniref:small ribosomal subunit protein cS23-like n=1 Tax=Nicotiana tomentosiformis TaxID=4098 RepID=UPI00051AB6B8|nr:30S ribosomal protein 3, chloroplastic-like isoform X1 [Nicotiana tomentosiformis]